MLNNESKLNPHLFADTVDRSPTRDGFGTGVVEAGEHDERVVVLTADLADSTRAAGFAKKFPERFVQMGVAEQNMATVASGMAAYGKIPFFTSYAAFSPGRNWEQIRTTIALNNVHAVVCGMHAGVSVGPDGATHQMLEDIALMRAMPNMIVLSPCDSVEAHKATVAAAQVGKPVYMRFHREKTPIMTTKDTSFKIGISYELWRSEEPRVALVGTGPLLYEALQAAQQLSREGIGSVVLNVHTIKPLDEQKIIALARECGAIVTIEEHQINGGLGGAVAECLSKHAPTNMVFVGVQDQFGQTGTPQELIAHYRLNAASITQTTRELLRD